MLLILGCTLALLFQFVNTSTPVELSSDFTATTFSSPSEWSVAFGNVGYQTENSKTLFGGVNNFDVSTQIQKIFILPPHYLIRIMVTIWTFGQWNNGEIKMLCDDKQIMSKKLYTMQNIYHKSPTTVNVVNNHNANTAIISIRPQIQDKYTQSWGIRDFIIQYYPCPNGCQICSDTDKQSSDCNKWILNYQQFTSNTISEMHNEGWFINDDKIQYTFDQCNGLSLFGYYGQGITLKRTFYLKPHNRIRIQFLFIKLNDWGESVFQMFIDDNLQLQIKDKSVKTHSINFCDSNGGLDLLQRQDFEFSHSNSLSIFQIKSTLSEKQFMNKYGIRDFIIYIQCDNCSSDQNIFFANTFISYFTSLTFTSPSIWEAKNQPELGRIYNCSSQGSTSGGRYKDESDKSGEISIFGRFVTGEHIIRTLILSPHRHLKFSLSIYMIDTFDDEWVYVKIDKQLPPYFSAQKSPKEGPSNICGYNDYNDKIVTCVYDQSHESNLITLDIYSTLDTNYTYDECFGIRDFRVQLGDCPFVCPFCNWIQGDFCEYKFWDEYWSLNTTYFQDLGGWGETNFIDAIPQITNCNGLSIIGGYGSLMHQGYLQLTQTVEYHKRLRIQLNLYIIGDWSDNLITIKANEIVVYSKYVTSSSTNLFCTSANVKAFIIHVDKVIEHTFHPVIIKITNYIPVYPEDNRSFGIRDFIMEYQVA